MTNKKTFGERLRQARESAAMRQEDAALAAGVGVWQWSRYECGHRTPHADSLPMIARAVGVSILDLLPDLPRTVKPN
jgi:transcriptional regulator with XRE-family HTH domain